MGKGFNNYMCKKFFHPASRDNLKRVWMAEQKADSYKKKQEELRVQYEKEQDLYNNKAMLSKESKDKLSVNFMYEPPPGAKKEREREDDEPEYKFEWQRKFNAPREDYCKGDSEIRDQPFGIQVRNVRCIKCHKWGHINTDKECPLFKQASVSHSANALDPLLLVQQMKEDGLAMKKSALETQHHIGLPEMSKQQDIIPSEDEGVQVTEADLQLLKSLSTKKKLKLLKKLEKMENGGNVAKDKKKKKKSKQYLEDEPVHGKKKRREHNISSKKHSKNKSKYSSTDSDISVQDKKLAVKINSSKNKKDNLTDSKSDSETDYVNNKKQKRKSSKVKIKKSKKYVSESNASSSSEEKISREKKSYKIHSKIKKKNHLRELNVSSDSHRYQPSEQLSGKQKMYSERNRKRRSESSDSGVSDSKKSKKRKYDEEDQKTHSRSHKSDRRYEDRKEKYSRSNK